MGLEVLILGLEYISFYVLVFLFFFSEAFGDLLLFPLQIFFFLSYNIISFFFISVFTNKRLHELYGEPRLSNLESNQPLL